MKIENSLKLKSLSKIIIPDLYPVVKVTPCGDFWIIWDDFYFIINDIEYKIEKNFLTDFASIPDCVWVTLFNDKDKYFAASVIHDYLCRNHVFSRDVCDEIFYRADIMCGISKYKSYHMW